MYLGDGLYAQHDGYHIRLTAMQGYTEHEVALDPDVLGAFDDYRKQITNIVALIQGEIAKEVLQDKEADESEI